MAKNKITTDLPLLGQVFNNGSMPSGPNLMYAVHPLTLTGLDGSGQVPAEGGTLAYTVDTTRTLLFHVLGDAQPQVGEVLIGHYISNGIWVAERMQTTGGVVIVPSGSCALCGTLWPSVIHLSISGTAFGYPATDTLNYVTNASLPAWAPASTQQPAGNTTQSSFWIGTALFDETFSGLTACTYVLTCFHVGANNQVRLYAGQTTGGGTSCFFLPCSVLVAQFFPCSGTGLLTTAVCSPFLITTNCSNLFPSVVISQ